MRLKYEAEGCQSASSQLELEIIYKTTTHRQFENAPSRAYLIQYDIQGNSSSKMSNLPLDG